MERHDDLFKIVQHYGVTAQKNIAIEELSELIKEICKHYRGESNINHIAEEIADVQIMINQLMIGMGLTPDVKKFYNAKIDRQLTRIAKEGE